MLISLIPSIRIKHCYVRRILHKLSFHIHFYQRLHEYIIFHVSNILLFIIAIMH